MPSKTKLQQFTEWLNTTASQERSKKNLGPEPIKLLLMANNGILGVWCGQTQPDDIAAGELWFNGQIVKHCTGVNPDVFVPPDHLLRRRREEWLRLLHHRTREPDP